MLCPKDATLLEEKRTDDVMLSTCPNCKGAWMDWGELRRISKNTVTEHELLYRGESKRLCPKCGLKMKKADLHSVVVEECKCGLFFDRGELEKVLGRRMSHSAGRIELTSSQLAELLKNGSVRADGIEIAVKP